MLTTAGGAVCGAEPLGPGLVDATHYFAVDLQPDAHEHLTLPLRLVFDIAYERRQSNPDLAIHQGFVNIAGQRWLREQLYEQCPLLLESLSDVFGSRMRTSSGELAAPDKIELVGYSSASPLGSAIFAHFVNVRHPPARLPARVCILSPSIR